MRSTNCADAWRVKQMTASDKNKELGRYLDGNDDISRVYRSTKNLGPPSVLDDRILQAARGQAKDRKASVLPFPRSWMAPLAAAATLLLAVGVVQWVGGPSRQPTVVVLDKRGDTMGIPRSDKDELAPLQVEEQQQSMVREQAEYHANTEPAAKTMRSIQYGRARAESEVDTVGGGGVAQKRSAQDAEAPGTRTINKSVPAPVSGADTALAPAAEAPLRDAARINESREMVAPKAAAAQSKDDKQLAPSQAARSWAKRLNIPYRALPEDVWRQRMDLTAPEWLAELRAVAATGNVDRVWGEMAAFAAVHGMDHPQFAVLLKESKLRRPVPATK